METLNAMMEPPEERPLSLDEQIALYRTNRKQTLKDAVATFRAPVSNAKRTMEASLPA